MPANRSNAWRRSDSSGSTKGSALRPRNENRPMPVACAACAITHDGIGDHGIIGGIGPIPFQHRELRQMQIAALAVAEHPRQLENPPFAGGQSFLQANSGEVRRYRGRASPSAPVSSVARRMQMGLVAGRDLQNAGLDLGESPAPRTRPGLRRVIAALAARNGLISACRPPTTRATLWSVFDHHRDASIGPQNLASKHKISMLRPETASRAPRPPCQSGQGPNIRKNSFESHRQFYSQGQRHRARRQALRRSDAPRTSIPARARPSARSKCAASATG